MKKESTKQCALMPLIKDYVVPLMKLYKTELHDEYYLNNATKCLYTAVLVMALYMGENSLSEIKKCDVDHVQKFYKQMREAAQKRNSSSVFDPSAIFARDCRKNLFSKTTSHRYLYYIMLTNANVPLVSNSNGNTILFPGHVCVIEKFPNGRYHLYQSYINNYDLNGHFERNKGSFSVSEPTLRRIFDEIVSLYDGGVWSAGTSLAWKQFTHVDGTEFDGREFKDRSFFCYRKIPIKTCTSRIKNTLSKAIKNNFDQDTKQELEKLKTALHRDFFSPEI